MLKIFITLIILIHGLIHFRGWMLSRSFSGTREARRIISIREGYLWLFCSLLFLFTGILYYFQSSTTWVVAMAGVMASQVVIIKNWKEAKFGTIVNGLILMWVFVGFNTWRFQHTFTEEVSRQQSIDFLNKLPIITADEFATLPMPVQKYLYYTHSVGRPAIKNFKVSFNGKIRGHEKSDWMPFYSVQYNFIDKPARLFYMKAKMKGLPVDGYHRYENGRASMDIRLLSFFQVQYLDGENMNVAETVTFFNDMCVLAPATLLDKRIRWFPAEGNVVKAIFTNQNITISAKLFFDEEGRLINFESDDRYNAEAGKKMKWLTPIKKYKDFHGYRLPSKADAVYRFPDADFVYGTFTLKDVEYNETLIH